MRYSRPFAVLATVLLIAATGAADTQWIPIVAHTPGVGGSLWQTDLRLLNSCELPATATLLLHSADGVTSHQLSVAGGGQAVLIDVVWIMTGASGVGALEIESDTELLATSRTYDATATERFGQVLEGVRATDAMSEGSVALLQNLAQHDQLRTNLGILNMGDETARVRLLLYDGSGVLAGELWHQVAPESVAQEDQPYQRRFHRSQVSGGFARVIVVEGEHVHVYASVVDGTTGDSATILTKAAPACDAGSQQPLDPSVIPQFAQEIVVPPVMPSIGSTGGAIEYEIAVRQVEQQVLPPGLPMTTVWAYGAPADSSTFHYPGFTIETRTNQTVRVTWINDLVDSDGRFLPHLLPLDQTLHWANPPGPRDTRGTSHALYTGPVPIVTHLHGAHVPSASDGYPEAWYLPDAADIPPGFATQGSFYSTVSPADPGTAVYEYPNDQRATTLWYHDHSLGMTRLNVYTGLAGFWLIRDEVEDGLDLPGPAPAMGDAAGTAYYEVPIVIQDRSFRSDGDLFYPDSRAFFDGYEGPFRPTTEVSPTWNPEFFGNTMVVNGRVWPYMEVEPRLYRLRFLNGSNSRFLILELDTAGIGFTQIGSDGGLLPDAPVETSQLLLAPAERADVIVDFSSLGPGQEVMLRNLGPDEPFKGPNPEEEQEPADPATTGRVMLFRVKAHSGQGEPGAVPATLPAIERLSTTLPSRDLTLNEIVDEAADIPVEAELGTASGGHLEWRAEITETPTVGDTEIWRLLNLTEDAHPIHLHLVMFQIIDRIPFDGEGYAEAQHEWLEGEGEMPEVDAFIIGSAAPPEPGEMGWKDTVIANPGEMTRLIATFDRPGLYVWHCHILEHEDNEMMRPYMVLSE